LWNDIAVDANGVVHIIYYNQTAGYLMHAYKASERVGWQTEVVDRTMNVGWWASMVVDRHNKVHIAYYNSNAQALKYANNVLGSWVTRVTGPTTSVVQRYGRLNDRCISHRPDRGHRSMPTP
jgi:hypothetical protein